jgi:EAL domain-containing protein (putative c-di-GMP-specific phosphodiesterase class I)
MTLKHVVDMLARWEQDTVVGELTLSIHISPPQFNHPGFVQDIQNALTKSDVNGGRLELEVTES